MQTGAYIARVARPSTFPFKSVQNKSLLELAIPNSELIRSRASIATAEFRNRLFVESGKLRATFTKPYENMRFCCP